VRVSSLAPSLARGPAAGPRSAAALLASLGLMALLFAGTGCGYTFVGGGAATAEEGGGPTRLVIRTLENTTSEPGAELVMTQALRAEFLGRSGYRLVTNPDAADWVLDGRVGPIEIQTKTFSTVVLALEQTLSMKVDLEIRDRDGRPLALSGNALAGSEVFLASADIEVSRKNRAEAMRRVASMIAERVGDVLDLEPHP